MEISMADFDSKPLIEAFRRTMKPERKPAYTAITIDNLDGTFEFLKRDADGKWVKAGNEEWADLATKVED
jgi:hypothetical protein